MGLFRSKSHHSQKSHQSSQPPNDIQHPEQQPHDDSSHGDNESGMQLTRTHSMSKNDAAASASQAAGTEWLSGHLNHLTDEQEQRFGEFKKLCEEKGYYKPSSAGQGEKPSHDDATMLRFLRARRFDVNAAWAQFKDTEDWRKDNAINALYENIDINSYESSRRMYPQWTGRRDYRGIPVYVFEIKHLNKENMTKYNASIDNSQVAETHKSSSISARLLCLFALYENLLRFVLPLCSKLSRPHPETPIVSSNNIVDISGVGLKQFWNLKSHMQDASVLATAHYPETLDRIFIIGAPSFFPTVWGWIKRWFDPNTTSKIFILSASEVKPTLTSFMPTSTIPKQYGGDLDWKWGDMPNLDDDARQHVGTLETPPTDETLARPGFAKGPVSYEGEQVEILGSVDGRSRRQVIAPASKGSQVENTESIHSAATAVGTEADSNAAAAGKSAALEEEQQTQTQAPTAAS